MTEEIISWSISTKVWDRAGIELVTPGSAVRLASVARHVTDCATQHRSFFIDFPMLSPLQIFKCLNGSHKARCRIRIIPSGTVGVFVVICGRLG